jgi:hypothetical protein
MNREDDDGFDRPFFTQSKGLNVLEDQLYGHVRAAVNFDALSQLEQHLALVLGDKFKLTLDLSLDLSTQMIEAALRRVAEDPIRIVQMGGPPDGITDEEKQAVAFDETCQFCLAAKQQRDRAKARAMAGEVEEEEFCACCEMLREDWRKEHADVLARAGLGPKATSAAITGAIEIAKRDSARRNKPS